MKYFIFTLLFKLDIEPQQSQMTNNIFWLDDDILLIVWGFDMHSTLTRGGDIYYYDIRDGSNGALIYHDRENFRYSIQANQLALNDDILSFYVYHVEFVFSNMFTAKYEHEIKKSQIYDLINNGESMTFDVYEIPKYAHEWKIIS